MENEVFVENEKYVYIYGLIDPRSSEIVRYIGKTNDLDLRLKHHIYSSKNSGSYKSKWIRSLIRDNVRPEIVVIERVLDAEWETKERYWISCYKQKYEKTNHKLTNVHPGGNFGIDDQKRKINRKRHKKYVGVRKNIKTGKFLSYFSMDNHLYSLGNYFVDRDAAEVRDIAVLLFYEDFSFINFEECFFHNLDFEIRFERMDFFKDLTAICEGMFGITLFSLICRNAQRGDFDCTIDSEYLKDEYRVVEMFRRSLTLLKWARLKGKLSTDLDEKSMKDFDEYYKDKSNRNFLFELICENLISHTEVVLTQEENIKDEDVPVWNPRDKWYLEDMRALDHNELLDPDGVFELGNIF